MIDNIKLTIEVILNNEIALMWFAAATLGIVVMLFLASFRLYGFRYKEDRWLTGIFSAMYILIIIMIFLIGNHPIHEHIYEEVSKEICVSKSYDSRKTIGNFYNEKDKEITNAERFGIYQEYVACKEENGDYENDKKELLKLLR